MLDVTPSKTAEIAARCEEIFADLDFSVARRWKAQEPGRKVVGYMPFYVPREMIHAAGALPLGIFGGGDQLEVIHGDAYYQSYICRIPRSTIELGVSGRLDFVDGMLFPSICDVIRNLSGMWKLMFPGVGGALYRLPQNFEDEVGGEFYRSELEELRRWLAEHRGQAGNGRSHPRLHRALQREPRAHPRAVCLACGRAVESALDRGLPAAARGARAAG